jgi:ATP-dependent helicase/nuclease subunit B
MGTLAAVEIDAWLRQGGLVVTASERAARALSTAFNRTRQSEGLKAWTAPNILDWSSFVRSAWSANTLDSRLLLNSTQEQSLWASIAAADGPLASLLEGPRYRLARLAMEAHELLCNHAPRFLRQAARSSWQNDAAAFSRWLSEFDESCRASNLISPARLPIELLQLLENPSPSAGKHDRPPLLLAGFDRILPVQRAVFDAWGAWHEAEPNSAAEQIHFYAAPDDQAELTACALWAKRQLTTNPEARILIVTQNAQRGRGQIERAFLSHTGSTSSPLFEFSLGIPLSQVPLARAANLLLRWLSGPLAEHELDWLFSTGLAAASTLECSALQAHMRALRRRGLEQPSWTVEAFIQPFVSQPQASLLPVAWLERITRAQRRLKELARRPQSPLDWAEYVPQLLQLLHFAESQPLSSAEFQASVRWQQAIETAGSLGFDGRRIDWKDFLSLLARTLDETLFAPESRDAPIQIAGPAESAGLIADAIWLLGATEDAWPAGGSTHPLLPPEVQREARMPHATAQLDWDLAHAITTRLLASASEVHFSYARQIEGVESRPSRLIAQLAALPHPLPSEFAAPPLPDPLTIPVEDFSQIPYPPGNVPGGASVLTSQSQCPFKAFATARLAAQGWEPAQAGLTPSQRGKLLHEVLHAVWAGPPRGIRTHADLQNLNDRQSFIAGHVERAFAEKMPSSLRQRLPARYLELEKQRLTRLVTAWLDFESTRIPFKVLETEADRTVTLAGLNFKLRLDRLDRLCDESVLVIDYKTGDVTPRSWDLPRPDDVQLPLYAGFAREADQVLGGLVFAKLRPGDLAFAGSVGAPSATLFAGLKNTSALAKNALTAEQLLDWRDAIGQLAEDFLAGRAEVDPRDPPKTCELCGLQTLCRIQENQIAVEAESNDAGSSNLAESADE